jgi:hypothetical protein
VDREAIDEVCILEYVATRLTRPGDSVRQCVEGDPMTSDTTNGGAFHPAQTQPASKSASLLAIWGLLPRLRGACAILAQTPENVTRSVTLSMQMPDDTPDEVARAIRFFAREHCVVAIVEVRKDRINVRLSREG